MEAKSADEIKKFVRERYAEIARQQTPSCCAPQSGEASSCCSQCATETSRAQSLYSTEELESIAADIPSLGCGNPIALSELKPGEVVLDLGSGGGLDCFLAAHKVGPQGKVVGLDMTPDMIQLARANAKDLSMDNVEFRLGEMEHMPIDSDSMDVVISNCVINLSPDKDDVFREVFRVLKPGGKALRIGYRYPRRAAGVGSREPGAMGGLHGWCPGGEGIPGKDSCCWFCSTRGTRRAPGPPQGGNCLRSRSPDSQHCGESL